MLNKELEKNLVCPITKKPLIYDEANERLVSVAARCAYPVRNFIPVMLPDEALPLTEEEIKTFIEKE